MIPVEAQLRTITMDFGPVRNIGCDTNQNKQHPIPQRVNWLPLPGIYTILHPSHEGRNLTRTLHRTLRSLGFETMGVHALRHTFATRAVESGIDVRTVSEILVHANISLTLQLYAHSTAPSKRKAIVALDQHFLVVRILMHSGSIIAQGTPKEVLTSENIEIAYGVKTKLESCGYINPFINE